MGSNTRTLFFGKKLLPIGGLRIFGIFLEIYIFLKFREILNESPKNPSRIKDLCQRVPQCFFRTHAPSMQETTRVPNVPKRIYNIVPRPDPAPPIQTQLLSILALRAPDAAFVANDKLCRRLRHCPKSLKMKQIRQKVLCQTSTFCSFSRVLFLMTKLWF